MSIRDRESAADKSVRTIVQRQERGFARPAIDCDGLTIALLFTVAALSALNFMLWFPQLGAVIASFNQF